MCPPLRLHLLGLRRPGEGLLGEAGLGVLTVGPGVGWAWRAAAGRGGSAWRAAAVFSHSFPRSSYLLSVWLW